MRLTHGFREVVKPTLGVMGVFVFFSLLFVGVYVVVEHKNYLAAYQKTQEGEIESLQQKIRTSLDHLKKLSQLTSSRIGVSRGNVDRIQTI